MNPSAKLRRLASAGALCLALSGCGYKPLNAPCAMDEGARPTQGANVEAAPTPTPHAPPGENTVQALSYAGSQPPLIAGPFTRVRKSDCGPLLPINAGALR